MNCVLLILHLTLLLHSALASLPAPVNVSIRSVNLQHVLSWDPGPGTPPGTQYQVFRVKRKLKQLAESAATSVQLRLKKPNELYLLTVRASYNQSLSAQSPTVDFTPYQDTIIDPPKLSLAGCGNCIRINISLPEADRHSGIDDIHRFYAAEYQILCHKRDETTVISHLTENRSFTLENLQEGTEYCIEVETRLLHNKHTKPSALMCTFTSIVEPSRGPVVLGAVTALLVVVVGSLMTSMFCLYYTGFICKLKGTLPRVLMEALGQSYTLTPERTIPDRISIGPEVDAQRKHNNPTAPRPATNSEEEEDEEEEEEGMHLYVDRAAELSSGKSSTENTGEVSGTPAASGDCGSFTEEVEVPDEDEANAEGAEVSFNPETSQAGVQEHTTGEVEEEEEVFDCSGNVNLFSVTLAALAACEEEEEEEEQDTRDSLTDFLKLSDLEPLLHRDSQTESDDHRTEDFTSTGYEGRRADASSGCLRTCDGETQQGETQEEEEEEEEEEEQEFSGYMRHT